MWSMEGGGGGAGGEDLSEMSRVNAKFINLLGIILEFVKMYLRMRDLLNIDYFSMP